MSDTKRSVVSWLKHSRLFGRQKHLPPNEPTLQGQSSRVSKVCEWNVKPASASTSIHSSGDSPQCLEKATPEHNNLSRSSENLMPDDFERFARISKSPTSHWKQDELRIRHSLRSQVLFNDSPQICPPVSLANDREDLRRVRSLIERKPYELEASTSFRRDQARASFRSSHARDRFQVKQPCHPANLKKSAEQYASGSVMPKDARGYDKPHDYALDQHVDFSPCRVRSFKVTKKGVINLGDNFMARSVHALNIANDIGEQSHFPNPNRTSSAQFNELRPRLIIPEQARNLIIPCQQCSILDGVYHTASTRTDSVVSTSALPWRPGESVMTLSPTDSDNQPIRIQILGTPNVGKTTLCRQMTTSEFLGARMESISEDTVERCVTVELDSQRWNVLLIDNFGEAGAEDVALVQNMLAQGLKPSVNGEQDHQDNPGQHSPVLHLLPSSKSTGCQLLLDVLVYLLVYAVDDQRSFDYATKVLEILTKKNSEQRSIVILVANKLDLVRNRLISSQKGKRLARLHGCKYFEISTAINHMIDELLVEIILQVKRLKQKCNTADCQDNLSSEEHSSSTFCLSRAALARYVRRQFMIISCEDMKNF
ncbi:hypothetical protein CRM22_003339 [Opisthorchis felineus]|uniref:Uncharacterized protein n=1 Tax=Opisthorchis felineus TaxID=147828 RepID=A0A4S2M292_OPIFE|nr:hypothetical protein CRM22_003339 [Opisthorchis felineus]